MEPGTLTPEERRATRCAVLEARGVLPPAGDALLTSTGTPDGAQLPAAWPSEEPMAADWATRLIGEADGNPWGLLSTGYVPLCYPVRAGMAECPEYIHARKTGRVEPPPGESMPDPILGLSLRLQDTIAGRLPVLEVKERAAFERVLQSLCHRNEPVAIPRSQGAALIGGLVNHWRAALHRSHAASLTKEQYQDCLIVLGRGPYSALTAESMGCNSEAEWIEVSSLLRRDHESAHYLTRRIFGMMRRAVFDEFVADAYALMALDKTIDAERLGTMLGIHAPPGTGRFLNYLDLNDMTDIGTVRSLLGDAACVLQQLIRDDPSPAQDPVVARGRMLAALYPLSLEELLAPDIRVRWSAAMEALACLGGGGQDFPGSSPRASTI